MGTISPRHLATYTEASERPLEIHAPSDLMVVGICTGRKKEGEKTNLAA